MDPVVKEKSKLGKELASMAQDIAKVRTLLTEQLSHNHGISNLAEAKRILNRKIAQYEQACKQRLVLLDQQEALEIGSLPKAQTEEEHEQRQSAISDIRAKYIKFRQNCESQHMTQMKAQADALNQEIIIPNIAMANKRKYH